MVKNYFFHKNMGCAGLTNYDILHIIKTLKIANFRGCFPRDVLPKKSHILECGIMNLSKSMEIGTHWVTYIKNGRKRIYFDSFGCVCPLELQKYLKTKREYECDVKCILRCTEQIQQFNTCICGHLCIFLLYLLQKKPKISYKLAIKKIKAHGGLRKFLCRIEKIRKKSRITA